MIALYVKDYYTNKYIKLDLFPDENIFIKSQLSSLEDPGKVFGDQVLSFTIPASKINQKALRYWHDRDVIVLANPQLSIDAYIEIGSLPYRYGVLEYKGGRLEDNYVGFYAVEFYTKDKQLTDLFKDDTIDNLTYSEDLIFSNNSTNFFKTINDDIFLDNDIITPLIAYTDRDWSYGDNTIFDIGSPTYSILNTELKPALKVIRIIEGIENRYGVTFSRDFLGGDVFNQLYIWMNSKASKPSGQVIIDIQNSITTSGTLPNNYFSCSVNTTDDVFTVTDNAFSYSPSRVFNLWVNFNTLRDPLSSSQYIDTYFTLTVVDDDTDTVYLTQTIKSNGAAQASFLFDIPQESVTTTRNLKFYLSSSVKFTYSTVNINFDYRIAPGNIQRAGSINNSGNYLNVYDVNYLLPSIKVIDFFKGIMKMFKLIIIPTDVNTFYIDTLNNYYDNGNIITITKYCSIKEVPFKKPDVYTNIKFKYEKTENVLGKKFRQTFDPISDEIGYGDLKAEFNLDKKNDLEVKLPFENMLFERMTLDVDDIGYINTNILIGMSCKLDDDQVTLTKNDGKPILFFNNGLNDISDTPIYIKYSGGSAVEVDEYKMVNNSNNLILGSVSQTINWGSEIDPYHLEDIDYSLFTNYWSRWISSIYDLRQQKRSYTTRLPLKLIHEIKLNDILIINDKRWRIESMDINLTNGDCKFELFVDTEIYNVIPNYLL